jgi:hypothetical protein
MELQMKLEFNIHERAKQMLADGYVGQLLDSPGRAEEYILIAADDPNVESHLPVTGFGFWKVCDYKYRVWKARQRFKRPRPSVPFTMDHQS